mmetsp:Transcript_37466/g.43613  ORF Transcript_37466/g.43613 Transcript_37466/m.43613 type:complete len:258 (+) Transcript_37466:300-1073(+)
MRLVVHKGAFPAEDALPAEAHPLAVEADPRQVLPLPLLPSPLVPSSLAVQLPANTVVLPGLPHALVLNAVVPAHHAEAVRDARWRGGRRGRRRRVVVNNPSLILTLHSHSAWAAIINTPHTPFEHTAGPSFGGRRLRLTILELERALTAVSERHDANTVRLVCNKGPSPSFVSELSVEEMRPFALAPSRNPVPLEAAAAGVHLGALAVELAVRPRAVEGDSVVPNHPAAAAVWAVKGVVPRASVLTVLAKGALAAVV